jgi:DNA transposition AAA+ family ATPase
MSSENSNPPSNVVKLEKREAADVEELRRRVRAELARGALSHSMAAKDVGIPKATFTQWLNDSATYSDKTTGKIESWLDGRDPVGSEALSFVDLPDEPPFYQTKTARRILNILSYCHAYRDMGCIYGDAGVGKTRSVRKYADGFENIFILTGAPEVATVHPMLEALARTVGLDDCTGGSRVISWQIREHLKAAKRPFVIIDEAQHLGLNALESLRSIHDETEVGMALVGNTMVYERLTGGAKTACFAQLFSRMGAQLRVRKPVPDDVSALGRAWGLDEQSSLDYLTQIARRPGALRSVTKVLRLAIAAVDGEVSKVTIKELRFAARDLGLEIVL